MFLFTLECGYHIVGVWKNGVVHGCDIGIHSQPPVVFSAGFCRLMVGIAGLGRFGQTDTRNSGCVRQSASQVVFV